MVDKDKYDSGIGIGDYVRNRVGIGSDGGNGNGILSFIISPIIYLIIIGILSFIVGGYLYLIFSMLSFSENINITYFDYVLLSTILLNIKFFFFREKK